MIMKRDEFIKLLEEWIEEYEIAHSDMLIVEKDGLIFFDPNDINPLNDWAFIIKLGLNDEYFLSDVEVPYSSTDETTAYDIDELTEILPDEFSVEGYGLYYDEDYDREYPVLVLKPVKDKPEGITVKKLVIDLGLILDIDKIELEFKGEGYKLGELWVARYDRETSTLEIYYDWVRVALERMGKI